MSLLTSRARQFAVRLVIPVMMMAALWPCSASATEGGGTAIYPDGIETYFMAAMPPPGFYTLLYGGVLNYDKVIGNGGNALPIPGFRVEAEALAPRFVWVTNQQIFGGQLAWGSTVPLLNVTFQANGHTFQDTGLGDISIGPGLGYHFGEHGHMVLATDFFLPTGQYDKNDPASLGKHYYAIQPILALSYVHPTGFNADIKMMYDFNGRNNATATTSGEAAHADFDAGWGLGNGIAVGAGGHIFEQITPDHGPNSAAGKSRAIGLGPSARYFNGKNFFIAGTLEKEFAVKNRPEGTQLFFKIGIPFD